MTTQHTLDEAVPVASQSPRGPQRTSQHRPGSNRHWRKPSPVVVFVAILALAGVALLQLPSIATWFSQLEYSREIMELNQASSGGDTEGREAALAAAHDYNARLNGAAIVGAGERIPKAEDVASGNDYDQLLAADSTGLMARIKIPSIDVDLPIYHGTSDEVLKQGVGHLEGTALPVGGDTTHTVLTGHRGLAQAELFDNLDRVGKGDTFTVEVFGDVLTYRVTNTQVVAPDETQSLFPVQGKDLATLVTCTPLGINTHRILVTGERVLPTPARDVESAGQDPTVPGFPWWVLWLASATLVIGGYVVLSCRTTTKEAPVEAAPPPTRAPKHMRVS